MVESSVSQFLESAAGRDESAWPEVVELGLPLVALPEDRGGSGLGGAGLVCIARQFGRARSAEPYGPCGAAPAAVAGALPPGPFADALLALVADGSTRVALAAHTNGAGARSGETVTGRWRHLAHPATHALVCAGDALCLIALDGPGVTLDRHPGLDGSTVADLTLAGAPTLQLETGSAAAAAFATGLAAGRLAHAARLAGLAERAFAITQDYIKTRVQFGQAIASFQAIQHRSVDQLIASSLTGASINAAAAAFDADPLAPATTAQIAAALARATTGATLVARESVQMHGGIGFTAEAEIGRYVRALTGLANFHGSARDNRRAFARLEDAVQ